MSFWKTLAPILLLTTCLPILAYARNNSSNSNGDTKENKRTRQGGERQSDGERKFAQNCGRCHNPPEILPLYLRDDCSSYARACGAQQTGRRGYLALPESLSNQAQWLSPVMRPPRWK